MIKVSRALESHNVGLPLQSSTLSCTSKEKEKASILISALLSLTALVLDILCSKRRCARLWP